MECEIIGCNNENEGYNLDDLEVCLSCYENAVENAVMRGKDVK